MWHYGINVLFAWAAGREFLRCVVFSMVCFLSSSQFDIPDQGLQRLEERIMTSDFTRTHGNTRTHVLIVSSSRPMFTAVGEDYIVYHILQGSPYFLDV